VVVRHQHIGGVFHANLSQVIEHVAAGEIDEHSFGPRTENVHIAGIVKEVELIRNVGKHDFLDDRIISPQPCRCSSGN
jgi:hypothetical protein